MLRIGVETAESHDTTAYDKGKKRTGGLVAWLTIRREEVSDVVTGQASGLSTPSIFNRSLDTSLTLRDGGAVILGGLISGSSSNGKSKIPLLGDIPVFGSLFRKAGNQDSQSELVILIQAFIMDLDDELDEFNKEMKQKFELIEYDKLGLDN